MKDEKATKIVKSIFLARVGDERRYGILTVREIAILAVIADHPGGSTKDVAEMVGISKPVITRSIDKLVRLGYALRQTGRNDKRLVLLSATADGKARLRRLMIAAVLGYAEG